MTNLQQNHILTDIQKHQHRFNVHQQQIRPQFNQQSFAFPQQAQNPNARFQQQLPHQQSPPAFRQVRNNYFFPAASQQLSFDSSFISQPSIIPAPQNIRQTQFQRSVHNQVGQISFAQQPQFVQQPAFQEPFNNFAPVASPLVQQPPIRPAQNFFPSQPVQFPQQPQNPFIQPTQSLPLEQRANLFHHDSRTEEQRQREEIARQKLIEKHERFAQKYYQNQQAQVQKLHEDFVKNQKKIQEETQEKLRTQQPQVIPQQTFIRQQNVRPTDYTAFEKSVQQYYQVNPTSPVPTTPQATTTNPLTVVPLKKSQSKSKSEVKTLNSDDIKALLQGNNQNLLSQLKQEAKTAQKSKSKSPLSRDDLLKQLKQALADETPDLGGKNYTAQDIVLPNGEKVQVIRTTDPDLIRQAKAGQLVEPLALSGTTQPPLSIADLAKNGFLPPGNIIE